ncbi:MAG: response regulator [bacterium]|jgi:CheY-like chemotaxis protein
MPKKVLLIDDEPDAVDFAKEILETMGHQVVFAHDGDSGIEKMRREKPDLVILDVQMPGKDGFQVFGIIKQDDELKATPVIMLTGIKEKVGLGFSADEMGKYMGEKPAVYVEKPIEPAKLQAAVNEVLGD